jgi:rubrerythrin
LKSESSGFPILEALKKARNIEEQLSKRYDRFAKFTGNEVASSIFTHLTSECRKHVRWCDDLSVLLGEARNLRYRGVSMLGRLPETVFDIGMQTPIETTFKIVNEHTVVEENVLRFYVELSHVISNDEAHRILQNLIEDESSHHKMLGKLSNDLNELYGERLALKLDE